MSRYAATHVLQNLQKTDRMLTGSAEAVGGTTQPVILLHARAVPHRSARRDIWR
jgi:hypothetical protein